MRQIGIAAALAAGLTLPTLGGTGTAENAIQWKAVGAPQPAFVGGLGLQRELVRLAGRASDRHVVVRMHLPVTEQARATFAAQGLTLLAPLGGRTYFAGLDPARLDARALAGGGWLAGVAAIDPAVKVSPRLMDGTDLSYASGPAPADAAPGPFAGGWIALCVELHPDAVPDVALIRDVEARTGGLVRDLVGVTNTLIVEMPRAGIGALTAMGAVQWVEPVLPALAPVNAENRALTGADVVNAPPYSLNGSGVTVLVFDGGTARSTHVDFQGRMTLIDTAPLSSHATHTSGTVGGAGVAVANNRGMAPGVLLLSAGVNITGATGWLYTNPVDIEADYTTAATQGADLATNSIGTNVSTNGFDCNWQGDYANTERLIDSMVRGSTVTNGDPFRIVWAAGNERQSTRCAGTNGGFRLTAPPAGAKNHLSIGAVNANDDSMTSFSSWGPTDDGRMKPDFCAPGCQNGGDGGITSTTSASDTSYGSSCGTSMACPTVAGLSALFLQDFRARFPARPDPRNSTLKAIYAQTAVETSNNTRPGPDYSFGYGSVRIVSAIDLMRAGRFTEHDVSTGVNRGYTVTIPPGEPTLKVTIAWDDVPGTANTAPELINDLDLELVSPSGTIFYPWTLNPASPTDNAVRTQANHLDNLEQVQVDNPEGGTWTVRVLANSIPQGPQPFSIAASHTIVGTPNVPAIFIVPQTLAPALIAPTQPTAVRCRILLDNETIVAGSPTLHYRFGPGAYTSASLTNVSGDIWEATIPGPACNDAPEYYFTASGATAGEKALPTAGPAGPYAAGVGGYAPALTEDFEASDAGWARATTGDTAVTGQWGRMNPEQTINGTNVVQPEDDVTPAPGVNCWVTNGLAGASVGANDIDGGFTTLLGAPYNLTSYADPQLSYWRWFDNSSGVFDQDRLIVDISNDGTTWTNVETVGTGAANGPNNSGGWVQFTFRVADFVPPAAATRLRFRAEDINAGGIVEAAIDDFRILSNICSGGPTCNADANDDGNIDQGDVDYLIDVVGGGANPTGFNADFNNDGNVDQGDIDALINVVGGGDCP